MADPDKLYNPDTEHFSFEVPSAEALCACGSGRKSKDCCFIGLFRQVDLIETNKIFAEMNKRIHNECCYYPGCNEKPIKSHIIQENGILSNLCNDKGMLYYTKQKLTSNIHSGQGSTVIKGSGASINLAGLREISFPGFCKKHDQLLFADVESNGFNLDNDWHTFLLMYRVFFALYDYYSQECKFIIEYPKKLAQLMKELNVSRLIPETDKATIETYTAWCKSVLAALSEDKLLFDEMILRGSFNENDIEAFFDVYEIYASPYGAYWKIDFAANPMDGSRFTPRQYTIVFPFEGKAICIDFYFKNSAPVYAPLSIAKHQMSPNELISSWFNRIPNAKYGEVVLSPHYWESLNAEEKECFEIIRKYGYSWFDEHRRQNCFPFFSQ